MIRSRLASSLASSEHHRGESRELSDKHSLTLEGWALDSEPTPGAIGPKDWRMRVDRNARPLDLTHAMDLATRAVVHPVVFFGTGTGTPGIFTLTEPRWVRLVK